MATLGCFGHGQPQVEELGFKHNLEGGNNPSSRRLLIARPCSRDTLLPVTASCEEPGTMGKLVPLLLTDQSLGGPEGPGISVGYTSSQVNPLLPALLRVLPCPRAAALMEPCVPAVLWPCLAPLCSGL